MWANRLMLLFNNQCMWANRLMLLFNNHTATQGLYNNEGYDMFSNIMDFLDIFFTFNHFFSIDTDNQYILLNLYHFGCRLICPLLLIFLSLAALVNFFFLFFFCQFFFIRERWMLSMWVNYYLMRKKSSKVKRLIYTFHFILSHI